MTDRPGEEPFADPPAELAAWRRARRQELLARRAALEPGVRRAASRAILTHLRRGFPPAPGQVTGFYWAVRDEFDPLPYLRRLIAAGGTAALPVVLGKSQPLAFREWRPGAAMLPGAYGIPVPETGAAVVPQLLLVPLLGFDPAGHRLGYGAGHYDRTLAALTPRPLAVGVGFALGRLATVHPQPHDRPMDFVVTEEGVFRRAADGLRTWPDRLSRRGRRGTP